jgi:hypothetical protein
VDHDSVSSPRPVTTGIAHEDEHPEVDRVDTIPFDLALEILRMNVAFIAAELGTVA